MKVYLLLLPLLGFWIVAASQAQNVHVSGSQVKALSAADVAKRKVLSEYLKSLEAKSDREIIYTVRQPVSEISSDTLAVLFPKWKFYIVPFEMKKHPDFKGNVAIAKGLYNLLGVNDSGARAEFFGSGNHDEFGRFLAANHARLRNADEARQIWAAHCHVLRQGWPKAESRREGPTHWHLGVERSGDAEYYYEVRTTAEGTVLSGKLRSRKVKTAVARDKALTFEKVFVRKSADRGPDLLWVVLTEPKANKVDLVLKYAAAALREATDHKFKGTTKGDEKYQYDGNIVFFVQETRGDASGAVSGFSVQQLQEILAAKDERARELVGSHSWGLQKLPGKEVKAKEGKTARRWDPKLFDGAFMFESSSAFKQYLLRANTVVIGKLTRWDEDKGTVQIDKRLHGQAEKEITFVGGGGLVQAKVGDKVIVVLSDDKGTIRLHSFCGAPGLYRHSGEFQKMVEALLAAKE